MKNKKQPPFYFSLFILFIVSSCHRDIQKEMASPSHALMMQTTTDKALASGYFTEGSWPETQWWRFFMDPQLDSLIEQGLQNSPTLQKAEASVKFAESNAKKIRSKLFPNLDAAVTDNWEYYSKYGFIRDFYPIQSGVVVPSKVNEIDLTLNFSYEFDFWGKNRKMFESALGLARAKRIEQSQTELVLATSIAFAYFQWQMHRAQLDFYQTWIDCQNQLQSLSKLKYQVGVDNLTAPLEQIESSNTVQQMLVNLQKELEIDLFVLKSLIGQGPDTEIQLMPISLRFERAVLLPQNIGIDLLARRPDLMAQIWRAESARQEIGVAKTEFYPNINLTAFGGVSSLSFNHLFLWDSRQGALQPAIHLPLFTGGRLEANLSEKVAAFNEAVFAYNQLLLDAVKEVASEITSLTSFSQQLEIQDTRVITQRDLLEIASARYEKGIDNYLSVLSVTENVLAQQISQVEMEKMRLFSLIRLIKSLGGGFQYEEVPTLAEKT